MSKATNLVFDDGYKEFTINNDPNRVIRFNPSDIAIVHRFNEVQDTFDRLLEEFKQTPPESKEAGQARLEEEVKKQIDYIFNQPVSETVFGNQSPLSPIGGKMLYERFLESIIPVVTEYFKEEKKLSQKRVSKYVKAATGK